MNYDLFSRAQLIKHKCDLNRGIFITTGALAPPTQRVEGGFNFYVNYVLLLFYCTYWLIHFKHMNQRTA